MSIRRPVTVGRCEVMSLTGELELLPSGYVLVVPQGELDLAETGHLDDLFDAALQVESHLIVDLSRVTFMDSSALSSFLRWHKSAQVLGGELVLVGASPRVQALLEITRLDEVLCVYSTTNGAVAGTGR